MQQELARQAHDMTAIRQTLAASNNSLPRLAALRRNDEKGNLNIA
jgi:hypothetical protein